MSTVKEILDIKGRDVWTIRANQTVFEAITAMAEKEVGALTVLDEEGRLAGIISERDYARKVILKDKASKELNVSDIMTPDVICVREDTDVDKCMMLMSQKKIRHLPVLEGDEVVGIITGSDLLKFIVKQQLMTIEELQSYIFGETGGSG